MYWHSLLRPFLVVWRWTIDQKIQATILLVLLATLLVSMLFEIPKLRKRIKFLEVELEDYRNPTGRRRAVTVTFSNHCRRSLKFLRLTQTSIKGVMERPHFFGSVESFHEGDLRTLAAYYEDSLFSLDDVRKVTIQDSVRQVYTGYLYKGEFRNRWIVYFLRLRDFLLFKS